MATDNDNDNEQLLAELADASRSPFEPGSSLADFEAAAPALHGLAGQCARLGVRLTGYVTSAASEREPAREHVTDVARRLRALHIASIAAQLDELEAALRQLEGN